MKIIAARLVTSMLVSAVWRSSAVMSPGGAAPALRNLSQKSNHSAASSRVNPTRPSSV